MAVLPDNGRGAYTKVGKDNGSRYYELIVGLPLDGNNPGKDANYLAVNLGVKAIQKRINSFGYSPKLVEDGRLGKATSDGIKWIQTKLRVASDGQAGPSTCKALFRDPVTWYAAWYGVPADQLWGMTSLESGFDPGAVGYLTPTDRGLCQINLVAHPDITPEEAHDPWFALDYTAKRFAAARKQFSGKTPNLQTVCSIAQHNAPAWAAAWYRDGKAPNLKIEDYVKKVLEAARTY